MRNTDVGNILPIMSRIVNDTASITIAMPNDTQHTPTVGDYIRIERLKRNWIQEDLGNRVGVSQKTISDIETGENEAGNLDLLRKLARELDLDLENLVIAARLAKNREGAKRVIAELPPAPTTTDDERREQAKAIIDKIPGKHLDALIPTLEVFARSR